MVATVAMWVGREATAGRAVELPPPGGDLSRNLSAASTKQAQNAAGATSRERLLEVFF